MGQVNIHVDAGNGVLAAFEPVENRNGILQILNPYFVDRNAAVIALILNILHI
jgi:hypothetical protein